MKLNQLMIAVAALGCFPVYAVSLGDAIESSKKEEKKDEPVLASGSVNGVLCTISEATLCEELQLPDGMSSRRRIKASKEGQVILFIKGKFLNQGDEKGSADIPKFLSSENKTYDGTTLYFHGVKAKVPFICLNPDEEYAFASYFFLPVNAIIGGKLLYENANPFSKKSAKMELKFDRSTTIHDSLIKAGITDNFLDARS